ncbi:hypothetical protein KDW_31490 [Dictyobacter vulcani]|uniref:Intein C-terminal splicing domain-containing protein n=1 Tax=Dictyobacter vulcani TaxID=2607529 RepID=A0A5J4KRJ7_9CHLR|nr:RHS repeat-associated core domain-containing protein [Dictyobacter vulcani]GER88987.1 hypothetical protein KDW_31490 [Dictyobacter vulcani]
MVDRYGNQIHVHYQQIHPSSSVIRDAVVSSIEYDDPTCHQTSFNGATAACSTWNPKVTLVFDASTKVNQLTNTSGGCANWTNTGFRCDDPVDLSSSGGLPIASAVDAYVLNDMQVQIQGHTLQKYVFSYEQTPPQKITDPLTGKQESAAGYLDLTQVQEQGDQGHSLNSPVLNVSYVSGIQHYEDLGMTATPTTNCGASWSPKNSSGQCYLWSQSYNGRYISVFDNGRGWHEAITWKEARANTHGVDTSNETLNDTFTCDGQETSTNLCGQADDNQWSRIVVQQRMSVTNTNVSGTWKYQYSLRTGWQNGFCSNCSSGFTWGNINDGDYADFYNGQFSSFASTLEFLPDASFKNHFFYSSPGWGVAESGITCYRKNGMQCAVVPYWNPDVGMAGKEKTVQVYTSDSKVLSVTNWFYSMNCPPAGVAHSQVLDSSITLGPPNNVGDQYLSSALDENNPVVVCDSRMTEEDDYQIDGVTDTAHFMTDPRVVHKQVNYDYDTDNQGPNQIAGYDYGNLSDTDVSGNDVSGHNVTHTAFYPNDNLANGIYLTALPEQTQIRDNTDYSKSNFYGCEQYFYGSNSSATTPATIPALTKTLSYLSPTDCTGSSVSTQHLFNSSGDAIAAIDGDNHLGCTSGTSQYTSCATFDSFGTHIIKATNAKNQTVTNTYDASSAAGGYGQWLLGMTNANGQTMSYQYDELGRLIGTVEPGDSTSAPTITYTYNNGCTNGGTGPCVELDTSRRTTVGGATTTARQWFDGLGHLLETRTPSPNSGKDILSYTLYDNMGRVTTTSLPYGVPTGTGFVAPDLTKARTVTSYDALDRPLGSVTYGDATTIVTSSSIIYTVAQGVPSFQYDTATPFQQTITLDAYNHQTIGFADALGRTRYTQAYSGTGTTGNTYAVVRTVQTNYDTANNVTSVLTEDGAQKNQAYYSATYNALGRNTGYNDPDSGACSASYLPPNCQNASDTAWKFTYDGNGNILSQTDPRGQATYTSYDVLDRPLCKGTTSASVSPCNSSAYATYFYDSYDNSSNPGVTFPTTCTAPTGSFASYPIDQRVAETFNGTPGSGSRCAGYDQRGQQDMRGLSVSVDGKTTTQTAYMSYNDMGQVTSLVYPDNETISAQFNTNGYLQSSYFGTSGTPDPVSFLVGQMSYTDSGLVSGMAFGGSGAKAGTPTAVFSTAMSYDGIQRPQTTSATRAGGTFWSQMRGYDNVGNVTSVNTTLSTTGNVLQTDSQSFCYDDLNRLVWAGNSGTPTGGDHCGNAPSGTTIGTYQQSYSYDALDRLTNGPSGATTYGGFPMHGAVTLGKMPNQYASYDAMGNMTCRNVDTTSNHSCDSTQTGAKITYDNEGRPNTWTAPNGTDADDQFLYDNAGNRVLERTRTGSTVTDTITFDGLTDVSITGASTSTTKYYAADGQRVAMRKDGTLTYLLPDLLSSTSVAVTSTGTIQAVQLFAPFGSTRYSDGTMPTPYNFTGQRLDSLTGLLYYNARYYDPISGRFTSADDVVTNSNGNDPYAYVSGNPETATDPTGHRMEGYDGSSANNESDGNGGNRLTVYETDGSNWASFSWNNYATSTCVYGCGGYSSRASHSSGGGHSSTKHSTGGHGGSKHTGSHAAPKPTHHESIASTGLHVVVKGLDLFLGVSSMINDWHTLTSNDAGWWDKTIAAGDLAMNLGMDVSMFMGIGEGLRAGALALKGGEELAEHGGVDLLEKSAAACGLSFSFATTVAVAGGSQSIGSLKVGQQVWAYNTQTKKMELEPIQHVIVTKDNDLVDLTISTQAPAKHLSSETIHTNKKHPFLVAGKGFVPVGQLRLGMPIVEANGQLGVVTGWKSVPGSQIMYNLTVTQDHTYTVGTNQWVVHNDGGPCKFVDKYAGHIFRDADGHLLNDTVENRKMFEDATNDAANYLGPDARGNEWYAKIIEGGKQVWVSARNNVIRNAGVNDIPHIYNPVSGLSKMITP